MKPFVRISRRFVGTFGVLILSGTIWSGCSTSSAIYWSASDGTCEIFKEMMSRKNRIVHFTPHATDPGKPDLLLLHGATDDPSEMLGIIREYKETHDVFLYSYNFHQRADKIAAALIKEMKKLRGGNVIGTNLTVVTFSYSATIFRAAVVLNEHEPVFQDARLIQLVPTAGGSFLARGMGAFARLVAVFSKSSAALYPFGNFAEQIWEGEGNEKFYRVIRQERMHTILLEGDSHSLSTMKDPKVRTRYQNGIGEFVTVIPEETGVTHDYFPLHPIALAHLRLLLSPSTAVDLPATNQVTMNTNSTLEIDLSGSR